MKFVPLVRTPLPQSECQGESTCCCAPYLVTLKPQMYARLFGVQPMRGIVITVFVPVRRSCSTNLSDTEPSGSCAGFALSFGTFSKNQSLAALNVSYK